MPVVRMPDGTEVRFPDEMPAEEIKGLIASKFPDAVPKASEAEKPDGYHRSMILPLGKDQKTGEISLAVPGVLAAIPGLVSGAYESAKSAVTAPGRAMSGELQVMGPDGHVTPEAIGEGANFAMWASPASPAAGLKAAPLLKGARPKPEGLQVAESASRLGVDLPRAVTSDKTAIQQLGKTLTSVPGGGTPLRKASETAIGQMDDAATRIRQGYGTGDVATAGSLAREGISDYAKGTLKAKVTQKYDAVDDLVTQNVLTPLENTSKVAADIMAKRQNAQMAGDSQAVSLVRQALGAKDGLNYQGIKDLRTSIGELVEDPQRLASSGISATELKRVYAGLTDDLKAAVSRSGGEKASKAFNEANTLAANVAREREALQSVLGRQTSDEGIFSKIEAMAGSTSRADQNGLMRVRRAVGKDTWDEITSSVLGRMGRDGNGNFSPDRFLTGYGKLSPTGKAMLFKTTGKKELAASLDDLAMVSNRFKRLNQFANPSGTAQSAITGAAGFGMLADPVTTVSSVLGSRVVSGILAKPVSAKKLADWAKAYEQAALNPGVKTQALLEARAKVLAIDLAAETGGAAVVQQILPAISRVSKLPAQPGNEDQGAQENKQGRVQQQPRMLLPNEL